MRLQSPRDSRRGECYATAAHRLHNWKDRTRRPRLFPRLRRGVTSTVRKAAALAESLQMEEKAEPDSGPPADGGLTDKSLVS